MLGCRYENEDVRGSKLEPRGERGVYVGTVDEYTLIEGIDCSSTGFLIKVGRRNTPIVSSYVTCFPSTFPGFEPAGTHPLRYDGPQEDTSEPHGIGTRLPARRATTPVTSGPPLPKVRSATAVRSAPLKRGDRRMVEAKVWPDYPCTEYGGQGWLVEAVEVRQIVLGDQVRECQGRAPQAVQE